jgi:hypothetical protein
MILLQRLSEYAVNSFGYETPSLRRVNRFGRQTTTRFVSLRLDLVPHS